MKVDNFVSNRLKNYIWYISVTTRPPQACIPGYAPADTQVHYLLHFTNQPLKVFYHYCLINLTLNK